VERDLRAGAMAGEAVIGAASPSAEGPVEALASVGRLLRRGASALVDAATEAATDDSTLQALDRLAGPRWRIAAQAADVAVSAARAAVRGAAGADVEPAAGSDGEPISRPEADTEETRLPRASVG
jgi:hypothetical protein